MSDYPFDAFLFYRSYREALNGMTQKDQLATLLAIIDYSLYGVEPKLTGKTPAAVFTVARPIIDANNARRTGGKKGGRPKRKTTGFSTEETIGSHDEKPGAFFNMEMKHEEHGNEEHGNEERSPLVPHGGKRERFTPPSVEEVAAYCLERKNGIDPEEFVSFYASKGWRVGTSPMRDWRSAVITWEKKRDKAADSRNAVKTEADYESGESFI